MQNLNFGKVGFNNQLLLHSSRLFSETLSWLEILHISRLLGLNNPVICLNPKLENWLIGPLLTTSQSSIDEKRPKLRFQIVILTVESTRKFLTRLSNSIDCYQFIVDGY